MHTHTHARTRTHTNMHTKFLDKKQFQEHSAVMHTVGSKYSNITVATPDRENCHVYTMNFSSQAASDKKLRKLPYTPIM